MYILLLIIVDAVIILNNPVSLEKCNAAKQALIEVNVKALCVPYEDYFKEKQ